MNVRTIQVLGFVLLASWYHPGPVMAQERFPRVQYLAGRPELLKPTEVTLVLVDGELRAEQTVYLDRGPSVRTLFTIPLANIISVGSSPRGDTGGLGVSSPLSEEEYVTLTLQAGDRMEAVVFKVERHQSAGIAAKIELAADKALEPPISQPAKARNVRSARRPLRLVKVVGRTAPAPRGRLRKIRARRPGRHAASYGHIERL